MARPNLWPAPPVTVEDADPPVRWGLGDAIAGTLLSLFVPTVVAVLVIVALGRDDLEGIPLWAIALLQVPLWAGLLGAPLWSTYRKGRRSLPADFGFRLRWSDLPLGLVVGFAGQLVLGLVITVLYDLLGVDTSRVGETAEELTDTATDAVGVVLLVLIVAIAAPVLEELFYRGLWLRALDRRVGTVAAVVLSSALFGALHLQWYDFPALFGFGLIAATLTAATGRLGAAICAHVAFNLTAVVSLLASR